ncbi:MAG TPA: TldD/PmbA family protein [Alphaproteobacteria bacterium]|nr:TldD/PmbA family protein [Alphaproteobacteria bacterium]
MSEAGRADDNDLDLLSELIARARKAGADTADAVLFRSAALEVSWRLGSREDLERSESRDLGLRVFVGRRAAVVSSTDLSAAALDELVERGVAMARLAPEDRYGGLADPDQLCRSMPELDLDEPGEPAPDTLYERAGAAEAAALAVEGISNSDGAGAGWGRSSVALATSHGFAGAYSATSHSFHASVVAGEGTGMERDYDFSSARYVGDLEEPAAVGRRAGERAVRRLQPRKASSRRVPVVYEPRVARSLLGHFAGAISGQAVARQTSFLLDRMGEAVFPAAIRIVDDPHRPRGLASKPFDGEGVANARSDLVDGGVLQGWLLDSAAARQLGLKSTGHAARGTSGPPSPAPTNLYMEPGALSPQELIADIEEGLFVTELIGFGVNGVTGDYSRGAAGFWIEKGEIAYPVSELTIAGNLKDMFLNLTAADDLEFRFGSNAPTLRVEGMTVAGT